MFWEKLYNFLGITDFINFISAPAIQEKLLPIKVVFILFFLVFLVLIGYFYVVSSYLKYHVFEDVSEFFSWQPYGLRQINKRWQKIHKKVKGASESAYKDAIIEADEFLHQTLLNKDYQGKNFEELVESARNKIFPNTEEIIKAHQTRNQIVHNPDYQINTEEAAKILACYEKTIKNIAL